MRCWGAAPDILLPASIRTVQNQGMERFDTVVIGAGIAGLTAARLLVAAGRTVVGPGPRRRTRADRSHGW